MKLEENRLKHMNNVAHFMSELAMNINKKYPNKYNLDPKELFILGLNHDIGYALDKDISKHGSEGGKTLQRLGFLYWKEVFYHGCLQSEFDSLELFLLNFCDMHILNTGEKCTFQERIKNISERYGENDDCVKIAKKIVIRLKQSRFYKELKSILNKTFNDL